MTTTFTTYIIALYKISNQFDEDIKRNSREGTFLKQRREQKRTGKNLRKKNLRREERLTYEENRPRENANKPSSKDNIAFLMSVINHPNM